MKIHELVRKADAAMLRHRKAKTPRERRRAITEYRRIYNRWNRKYRRICREFLYFVEFDV